MHDTTTTALIQRLQAALSTALDRYGMMAPDMEPGEEPAEDENEVLREELEEIHAAHEAAEEYLATQVAAASVCVECEEPATGRTGDVPHCDAC
jgi:hypothetical protein